MCGDEPHVLDIAYTHYYVRVLTGYNFFRACLGRDQVFMLDSCPAGRVIYIASAVVGHSKSITWNESNSQCYLGSRVYCWKRTYHQEIMRCNGRRDCSITRNSFDQTCGSRTPRHVNFIDIRYICLEGKSTMRTLYDGDFTWGVKF